jgi:hypothetical protein
VSDDPRGQYTPPQPTGTTLVDPEQVTVEVAISPTSQRILLRVTSTTGTVEVEQLWCEGIRELVVDLGREFLLVLRPGEPPTRRERPE